MSDKKPLILALVVFNAALLAALLVVHGDRSAQAQVIPSAVGRFLAVPQAIRSNDSVVWVIDTVSRRALVYRYDTSRERTQVVQPVDLRRLFRYRGEGVVEPEGRRTKPPT